MTLSITTLNLTMKKHGTQHNAIQHDYSQFSNKNMTPSIMAFSITKNVTLNMTAFSKMTFSVAHSVKHNGYHDNSQHNYKKC